MSRLPSQNISLIYDAAAQWKQKCLIEGGSLFWPGEKVWGAENLDRFKKCFIDNPDDFGSHESKMTGDHDCTHYTVSSCLNILLDTILWSNEVAH